MNPSSICKFLLRDTELLSSLLDFKTKFFEKIYICLHTLIIVCKIIVNTVGLQHTIISIIYNESIKSKNCKNAAQAKITIHIIIVYHDISGEIAIFIIFICHD